MKKKLFVLLILILSFALAACNLGVPAPQDPGAPATFAAQTIEAVLSPAASPTAQESPTPQTAAATSSAGQSCEENGSITSWTRDGITYDKQEVDKRLAPGKNFTMSWIVQNNGSCVWNDDYKMIFTSGERLTQMDSFPVMPKGYTVRNGEALTITIQMTAPSAPGDYESSFSFINAQGDAVLNFGVLTNVGTPSSSGKLSAPGDLRYNYDCTSGIVSITLIWVDKANDEDGYRIYRDGSKLADLPAGSTTYNDIAPAPGSYQYTVAAFNLGGESAANVRAETANCK